MEIVPLVSSTEKSLPSALRRHFQLVRLLDAEANLRGNCSKQDLLLIAHRCEDLRRGFLDAVLLFQPTTRVRLIKMEFLRLWSQVAINIYRDLLTAEIVDDPEAENLVKTIHELVSSVPEQDGKSSVKNQSMHKGVKCLLCADSHSLTQCTNFGKMELWEKRHFMRKHALCFLCLQSGHSKIDCRSAQVCVQCSNRHATIVHDVMKAIGLAAEASRHFSCVVCGSGHMLYQCDRFGELKPAGRKDLVDRNQLCMNCLHSGHTARQCQHPESCRHCGERHHSLLHLAFGPAVRRE